MKQEEFIEQEISKLRNDTKYGLIFKGNKVLIRCHWHKNGQERTPSFIINLVEEGGYKAGDGFCFGCKVFKQWNEIAEAYDLRQLSVNDLYVDYVRNLVSDADKNNFFGTDYHKITPITWNPNTSWRGINGELLNKLGAKLSYNEIVNEPQLYLPVNMFEETIGGINCSLTKREGFPSYIYEPTGHWIKGNLFPFDYVSNQCPEFLMIGEGCRDALNPIQHGLPSLMTFGANNINESTVNKLLAITSLRLIVLGFDSDEAGENASRQAGILLKRKINFVKVKFPSNKKDPGDLNKSEIGKIIKYCKKIIKKL